MVGERRPCVRNIAGAVTPLSVSDYLVSFFDANIRIISLIVIISRRVLQYNDDNAHCFFPSQASVVSAIGVLIRGR